MHGGQSLGLEAAAGQDAELLAAERRPRGGDADLGDTAVGFLGDKAGGGERRVATLGRAHADRGEALDQLELAIAVGDRVDDVLDLQVLVEVDEVLAVFMGEDRPGMIDPDIAPRGRLLRRVAGLQAERAQRLPGGVAAVRQRCLQVVGAGDRAGNAQMGGQAGDREQRAVVVVAQLGAGLERQLVGRRVARREADQVAIDRAGRAPCPPLAVERSQDRALHMAVAVGGERLGDAVGPLDRDAARRDRRAHRAVRRDAQVDQGGDLDPGVGQVERHGGAVLVAAQHDRALARFDSVELDQALGGRALHDAGQVVVAELGRLLDRAARQDRPRWHAPCAGGCLGSPAASCRRTRRYRPRRS